SGQLADGGVTSARNPGTCPAQVQYTVLNIAVAEPGLQRPRIVPCICERVAACVPQHVEPRKHQAVNVAEGQSLRGFAPQHVELVSKDKDLGFQRSPRPALWLPANSSGCYRHAVTEFIGEYPLRHPLKVWRDSSDRISALRIVTLMCLFAPLSKAIYDSDAIRLDARPITELIHRAGDWALIFLLVALAVRPLSRILRFNQ